MVNYVGDDELLIYIMEKLKIVGGWAIVSRIKLRRVVKVRAVSS